MTHPVLWHFTFSHFAEKARWALDFKGIPHVRKAFLPGLHLPRVWWTTGQALVPVLFLDGKAIADSTKIIAALEQWRPEPALYPRDERERQHALALEEFFDEELGHYLRRALMHEGFSAGEKGMDYGAALFTTGYGPGVQRIARRFARAMRAFLTRHFDVNDASARVARAKVLAALDRIEAELQPSGYLVGDGFSVADLTAAALFQPLVLPPEFHYALPAIPDTTARYRDSLAGHPAFQWVAEMYRRQRGASMEVAPEAASRGRRSHAVASGGAPP